MGYTRWRIDRVPATPEAGIVQCTGRARQAQFPVAERELGRIFQRRSEHHLRPNQFKTFIENDWKMIHPFELK
jgi:hypothetical protein